MDARHAKTGSACSGPLANTLGVVWLVMSLAIGPTWAASSGLEPHLSQASGTRLRADDLFEQVGPGRSFTTSQDAVVRFQDLVYLHLIGEYEPAAEGFFVLVTSGSLVDEGLHRDAEWYLAESLYKLGNYDTAVSRYQVVVDDKRHPFREDAVRRLLEIYSELGDLEAFNGVYEREVVRGGIRPTDAIIYTVGKSFYEQGRYDQARANFEDVDPGGAFGGRTDYFLGVMAVVEGRLEAALDHFKGVAERSIDDEIDRQVHDLALLAIGRIRYEQGSYREAREAYERISADSHAQADKLYELVWTDIRRGAKVEDPRARSEAYHAALTGIEIFLIGYPEHRHAPSLRVVQGKLHMVEVEYDNALGVFESVVAEYLPVEERFGEMAVASTDLAVFDEVRHLAEADGSAAGLPAYAVSLAMADPELSKAVILYRDIEQQERNIEVSEALIRDISGALGEHTTLGGLQELRYDALVTSRAATRQQLDLLAFEEEALRGKADARRLDELASRRAELEQRARQVEATESDLRSALESWQLHVGRVRSEAVSTQHLADEHAEELEALRAQLEGQSSLDPATRGTILDDISALEQDLSATRTLLRELEQELTGLTRPQGDYGAYAQSPELTQLLDAIEALRRDQAGARPSDFGQAREIDDAHGDLVYAHRRVSDIHQALDELEGTELQRVKALFEREVQEVADERVTLASLQGDAQGVAGHLARAGFTRLESFFHNSVLEADLGIVDVYWAQRVEVSDEVERVKLERAALLRQLDERFELIRDKLGD